MASALQGAMASAQLTTDAMAGVANMVTSTLNRATQERQLQSNIMEGMIRSAQNAKQMEMDEFFKSKDLELRSRQLEISNQYRGIDIGLENAKLLVDQRRVSVAEDQVRLAEEKIVEADKHKPWIKNLGQERALLGKSLEEELRRAKDDQDRLLAEINGREASGANPAILGMSPVERIKDELNPNGKHAQLKLLQTEKARALEEKQRKLKDIDEELRHVTGGGEPGVYVPIPKPKTTSSINTSGENSEYLYQTDDDGYTYPSLLPKLPNSASDDAKAGVRLIDEEIAMLEGQVPSYDEMQPIDKDVEAKEFTKKYDSKLLGAIYDKNTRIQDIPALIVELSPESKAKIEEAKVVHESAFLSNYGRAKGFDPDKDYESESKASEHFSEMYARSGGDPLNLNFLGAEAEIKLIDLQAEGDALSINNESINVRSYVANGYKKWVSDRLVKQKEVVKDKAGDDVKKGLPDFDPLKYTRGELPKTEAEQQKELDAIFSELDMSVDTRKNIDKAKAEADKVVDFTNKFISAKSGFNRVAFYNSATKDEKLRYILAPPDTSYLTSAFGSDEFGRTNPDEDKVRENERNKEVLKKIKTLTPEQAFKLWSNR